jgi:GNAT superfamily N-acetyltransferase
VLADRIIISRVQVDRVVDLRHRILRAGMSRDAAIFEGDDELDAIHLAALNGWDMVVGCATLIARPWNHKPAWQLRGMAVDSSFQQMGIGRLLLDETYRLIQDMPDRPTLWCNARKPAAGFYEKLGWQRASAEFEIPTAGPHYKMVWKPDDS